MWRASFRSSCAEIGSLLTKRSVSRITPSLKLWAIPALDPIPRVTSTLPPPMSTTTATSRDKPTP